MMRRVWLALLLAGCGSESSEEAPEVDRGMSADGGSTVDMGPLPDAAVLVDVGMPDSGSVSRCQVEVAPARVIEGGRVRIPLSTQGEPTLQVNQAPAKWRTTWDGDTLEIKVTYGSVGETKSVEIGAFCADGQTSVVAEITIEPLRWTPLTPWTQEDGPLEREYFSMWFDPMDADRLLVFGGFHYRPRQFTTAWDLWEMDVPNETWSELRTAGEPPHLAGGGMAQVPGQSTSYYYGGLFVEGMSSNLPFSLARFDYGDLTSWRSVPVEGAAGSGDYQPAFFHHPGSSQFLAIGGQGGQGTHVNVFAYSPDAGTWSAVDVAVGDRPTGRTGFFWTYDAPTDRFIMFAGEQGGGEGGDCNCAQDTWALELGETPVRWVKLADAQDPPIGRRNGAYALDPLGHRLFVWGGTPDGANTQPGLQALELERGHEGWHQIDAVDPPPERTSGGAVFDAARNRILMGFGNGSGGIYADLWALDLVPSDAP